MRSCGLDASVQVSVRIPRQNAGRNPNWNMSPASREAETDSPTPGTQSMSRPRTRPTSGQEQPGSRRRPRGPSADHILRPSPSTARPAGPSSVSHPGCAAAATTSPSTSTSASSASMTALDPPLLARSREMRRGGGGTEGGACNVARRLPGEAAGKVLASQCIVKASSGQRGVSRFSRFSRVLHWVTHSRYLSIRTRDPAL